jgi:uncharacterized membrane protein
MSVTDGKIRARAVQVSGVRGNERIGAFSDGVFSIAITLLVLDLHIPASLPPGGLVRLLPALWPRFVGHVVSFAVLGIYWVGHHNIFMHIKRHDRILLWLNILFLMCVAAMPFLAGLLTEYGDDRIAVIAYAGMLAVAGLVLDSIWGYATHHFRLVEQSMDPDLVIFVHRRVLLAPVLYVLAIVISFWSLTAAKVLFAVVVVVYIVPSPMDVYHHKQLGASE